MSFGFEMTDIHLNVYTHFMKIGKKVELLKKDSRVCVEFSIFNDFPDKKYKGHGHDYRCVITKGKIRYVPPKNWSSSQPLPKRNGGYVDKFGNVWTKGPSRTAGQSFEWDVQLSKTGKKSLGWASRDGSHLNVSLDGKITHK